jgi:predicted nucleotide-binding protein
MTQRKKTKPTIIWADDDTYLMAGLMNPFYTHGYEVLTATNGSEALDLIEKLKGKVDLVILDIRLPPGESLSAEITHGGFETGIAVGSLIRKKYPHVPLLGFSIDSSERVVNWFKDEGQWFIEKAKMTPSELYRHAESIIRKTINNAIRQPKIFIVHGHDDVAKLSLKNYLQNTLNLGEPIILHEQPNLGRTIIEKFEEEAKNIDVVFVLLTPDDIIAQSSSDLEKRRTRQNVIFELGYFLGALRRQSGKVILLHKGNLEIPSDISGITYIDISTTIEAAGEQIRRELQEWLTKNKVQ